MNISEVMTRDVTTAELDSSLEQVAQMMKDEDAGAIPVLDDNGELCGIVTDRDIVIRCIAEGKNPAETSVEDVLSEEVRTVAPDDDVREALRIMADHQIRRLPVIEEGELVGVVSLGDIAVKEDEKSAGQTLSQVSEGVKRQGRGSPETRASQRGSQPQKRTAGRMQVISNRSAREEQGRQARVSPARSRKASATSSSRSSRRHRAS
jgi:CBS domain-containing protein